MKINSLPANSRVLRERTQTSLSTGETLRRVLLVAYHFPPSSLVGALRWEKLVATLAAHNFEFDVLTLDPSQVSTLDEVRLGRLPASVRVLGVKHRIPIASRAWSALAKLTGRLRRASPSNATSRRSATTPTADVGGAAPVPLNRRLRMAINSRLDVATELAWGLSAARIGERLHEAHRYDAVICSGPPHYAMHAGFLLNRRVGLPFIADFRDPWSLAESSTGTYDVKFMRESARTFEARIVSSAALITMNTEAASVEMRKFYRSSAERIVTVMNGSDPEDYVESPTRERFTLLYAGSLYLQRDPRVLFRSCAALVTEFSLTPTQFAIQFLGPSERYEGKLVTEIATEFGLGAHCIVSGLVPRSEALRLSATATQLVCLPDGQSLTIPAKLFEYVQLDAWILAFAEPSSAMALALEGTHADVVAPNDIEAASRILRARWIEFSGGVRPTAVGSDGRFLRSAQALKLLDALKSHVFQEKRAKGGMPEHPLE